AGHRGRPRRRAGRGAAPVQRRGRPERGAGHRVVGGRDGADRPDRAVRCPCAAGPRPPGGLGQRAEPAPRRGAAAARAGPATARRHAPDGGLRPAVRPGPVRAAGGRHPDRRSGRRRLAARGPDDGGGGETLPKLAINRLRERRPLDAAAVDRFLARHEVPIVEGDRCTFLWRGAADAMNLVHRIIGLPDRLPLRRVHGTDLWSVVLELPAGSRVNYQLEVRRGEYVESMNDPLNPKLSYSPVGTSSVCFASGYTTPDWTEYDPDARPGTLTDIVVPSRALRRDCPVTVYLPARFRRTVAYPLLVVHDGGDFLQYAAAKTVLDNLVHRLDVAELVVAFVRPGNRLVE